MSRSFKLFAALTIAGQLALTGAHAGPTLPDTAVAANAALAATGQLVAAANPDAAKLRQQGIQDAQKGITKRPARTAVLRATAYNSAPNQTDSTPFITATGTRTRFGVVALSRDMLRQFPYGTKIMIEDLSGKYNNLLKGQVFIVEDTMHQRKRNQVDVWMTSYRQAMQFGVRQVRITAID